VHTDQHQEESDKKLPKNLFIKSYPVWTGNVLECRDRRNRAVPDGDDNLLDSLAQITAAAGLHCVAISLSHHGE